MSNILNNGLIWLKYLLKMIINTRFIIFINTSYGLDNEAYFVSSPLPHDSL